MYKNWNNMYIVKLRMQQEYLRVDMFLAMSRGNEVKVLNM